MDLADAALVRVAEHERTRRMFTVDQRDFMDTLFFRSNSRMITSFTTGAEKQRTFPA
jgi:hypothetical protein